RVADRRAEDGAAARRRVLAAEPVARRDEGRGDELVAPRAELGARRLQLRLAGDELRIGEMGPTGLLLHLLALQRGTGLRVDADEGADRVRGGGGGAGRRVQEGRGRAFRSRTRAIGSAAGERGGEPERDESTPADPAKGADGSHAVLRG